MNATISDMNQALGQNLGDAAQFSASVGAGLVTLMFFVAGLSAVSILLWLFLRKVVRG